MKKTNAKDIFDYAFFMNAKTLEEAMRYTSIEPITFQWFDDEISYGWPKHNKTITEAVTQKDIT